MTVVVSSSRIWKNNSAAANTPSFREFISTWTGMFSQGGWVNTNASGSVDPLTVSASNAATAYPAYQVWRFDDYLHHSGYPVYVKIEYGNSADVDNSSVGISSGFWHNGSGSICPGGGEIGCSPRIATVIDGFSLVTGTDLQFTHKLCCISGSDMVALIGDTTTASFVATVMFSVERTKDTNGNPTTDGVVVCTTGRPSATGTTGTYSQTYFTYGPNSASQTPQIETIPNYLVAQSSGIYNNDLTVGLLIPMLTSSFGYPSRMAGFVPSFTLTPGTTHELMLFNTASTYYVSTNTSPTQTTMHGRNASATNSYRYIIRHE